MLLFWNISDSSDYAKDFEGSLAVLSLISTALLDYSQVLRETLSRLEWNKTDMMPNVY